MRNSLPGAAALLAAPVAGIAAAIVQPTLSDGAAEQVAALTNHRGAMIAAMVISGVAIALLIGGTVWLATSLAPLAPRLALAGGVLGVLGSLVVLFESGVSAAMPAIVAGLDTPQATATVDRVQSSAGLSGLEPLSLAGDVGLALLGLALVRAGASRAAAAAIAVGAFTEGAGFATGTRGAVLIGFVLLLIGLAAALRPVLLRAPRRVAAQPLAVPSA